MFPTGLSRIYRSIDRFLHVVAVLGSVAMVALVMITMYDVITRYTDLPKDVIAAVPGLGFLEGMNSTMVQEAEYWAHGILFCLFLGYGFTRQVHVRIDLVRDMMPTRVKYWLELIGIIVFLLPFAYISFRYSIDYAVKSFTSHEISPSTNGLTNFWIFKSFMVAMFALLLLAGLSQALKCIDGLRNRLSDAESDRVLGSGH